MFFSRFGRLAAVVLLGGLALAGCAGQGQLPEPWRYACTWSSDNGDRFVLGSDASATVDVAGALLLETITSSDIDSGQRYEAQARWIIGNGVLYRDQDGAPALTIILDTADGPRFWRLNAQGATDDLQLLSARQDADDRSRTSFTSSNCFDPGLG